MDGFMLLFLLSVAMFLGCYLAGLVPLAFTLSDKKLRLVTVLGAGLLVGTALAVIIPEGVHAIYEVETDNHDSFHEGASETDHSWRNHPHETVPGDTPKVAAPLTMSLTGAAAAAAAKKGREKSDKAKENDIDESKKDEKLQRVKRNAALPQEAGRASVDKRIPPDSVLAAEQLAAAAAASSHGHGVSAHSAIGLTLVLGFIFMLIVDQISAHRTSSSYNSESGVVQKRYNVTATVGLVVHAAADGIALGAASSVTTHKEIQLIVFVAIMLHKAPAAFGLVTFLLHEGLERTRIRRHLLVFALAAPLAAVVTYVAIHQGGGETFQSMRTTGLLMLFSAGTFLYVATVHVLPEIVGAGSHGCRPSQGPSHPVLGGSPSGLHLASTSSDDDETGASGRLQLGGLARTVVDVGDARRSSSAATANGGGFTCGELCALIVGALVPAIISISHSH